jgi:hypothetical protein
MANIQVIRIGCGFIGSSFREALFCMRSFARMLRDHFRPEAI